LVEGLFVLAHSERSRLLLLGIANSIDLVQQLMRAGGPLHVSILVPVRRLLCAVICFARPLVPAWCSS